MARLSSCKYCHGTVCNARWHEKCRLALAEDLLAQIKQAIAEGKATDLADVVREGVLSENWEKVPLKKTLEQLFEEGIPLMLPRFR
ncbi:MAG: hypothetical protein HYV54_01320 [Parcubacteria group bacterium]|nr:hypothetical protein [Parcubacteria group bacterium]